ncbi:MAG: hypothetical protein M5R36_05160 [Deltaproteobacteria bacterium]|nr:hypothetical protein [Deltaproteobacteria bacterium]
MRTIPSGKAPNDVASAATSAAAVGVTSSPSRSVPRTGRPFKSDNVAGAGSGSVPCAHSTKPFPVGSGETRTASAPSAWMPAQTPTMSMMLSSAPTSWKCTSSMSMPCTAASASARRCIAFLADDLTPSS